MVPERPVGPCYHSRWPSWHDSSPRKPRSPCKSTRQAFPLSLRTSTSIFSFGRFQTDYFRSLSLSSVWFSFHFVCRLLETTSECAERFHTPGNIPDERERKRERERERERESFQTPTRDKSRVCTTKKPSTAATLLVLRDTLFVFADFALRRILFFSLELFPTYFESNCYSKFSCTRAWIKSQACFSKRMKTVT